jgi:hypothetical protein
MCDGRSPTNWFSYRREGVNVQQKLGLENSDIVCDMPLPINEWPHPARLVTITETSELTTYPIEIYTDGSKVGARAAIYSNKQLINL